MQPDAAEHICFIVLSMSSHYKSPLAGYENAEPLPMTLNADGKSFFNPPGPRSAAYDDFPAPIDSSNNGFDFHSTSFVCAFSHFPEQP